MLVWHNSSPDFVGPLSLVASPCRPRYDHRSNTTRPLNVEAFLCMPMRRNARVPLLGSVSAWGSYTPCAS